MKNSDVQRKTDPDRQKRTRVDLLLRIHLLVIGQKRPHNEDPGRILDKRSEKPISSAISDTKWSNFPIKVNKPISNYEP